MKRETQTRKLENNTGKSKLCHTFGVFGFKMIKAVQGDKRNVQQPNSFSTRASNWQSICCRPLLVDFKVFFDKQEFILNTYVLDETTHNTLTHLCHLN